MDKVEKARRRRIMAEIDQKADCGGHNHGMAVGGGPGPSFDFLPLALVAGMIARRAKKWRI